MTNYRSFGSRRHRAKVEQHDGTVDAHGTPTYHTSSDWDTVVLSWPCELLTASGGEKIRGRQTSSETTHVFFGDYAAASAVTSSMRVICNSQAYGIVSVYDANGDGREIRIEAKIET